MKQRDIIYHLISVILFGVTSVIILVLIISTMSMYSKGCLAEENFEIHREAVDSIANELYFKYAVVDLPKTDSLSQIDQKELIKTMLGHIKMVEDRQNEVLNDLRQESNNIINKVNGWLGFWMGIFALFGGLLPLLLQYVLYKRSEIKTNALMESTSKKADSCHLQLLVSTICLQYEMGIITDNVKKVDLINIMLNEMKTSLNNLVSIVADNDKEIDHTNETPLLNALIQYGRVIDVLIMIDRDAGRNYRDLLNIRDNLRELITAILTHQKKGRREVWNKLMDLYPSLKSLSAKR